MLMTPAESATRHDALLLRVAHLVSSRDGTHPGGAMLGPRLFLLPALDRLSDERLIRLGTAIELLRRATVIHRTPQAEGTWEGYPPHRFSQTLQGDTLLAESFRLLAQDGEPRTVALLSRAMAGVSEGEMEDFDGEAEEGDAARRRASFYEGAAEAGALLGGLSPEDAARYAEWGRQVGECHERAISGDGCGEDARAELQRCPLYAAKPLVEAVLARIGSPETG